MLNFKPELIIFDCDGVLIDSEVIANRVNVEVLSGLGVEFTLEEYMERFVGVSLRDEVVEIERLRNVKLPDDYEARLMSYKNKIFDAELKAIEGIVEFVTSIQTLKAVASGSSPERLEHTLKVTHLWELFAPHIYSTTLVPKSKPAPDIFLYTAEKFKVMPEKCLVIEDSTLGVRAGVAAGMTVLGFTGGSHIKNGHAEKLVELGATKVFSNMKDLASWLNL
ncbi:MAG: HAD family hydrolase [Trueperaceae bacterium]